MWPALGRWYGSGAWAKYFDNAADGDDLDFEDWQVIDMAGAAEHEDLCEAALFYLLERLRLALENPDETARVKLMVVDEAWKYLQDPAVLGYLAEAAKTWAQEERGFNYGDSIRCGRNRDRRGGSLARIHADQGCSLPTRSCRRRPLTPSGSTLPK